MNNQLIEMSLVTPNWNNFLGIMKLTAHANKPADALQAMLVQEVEYMHMIITEKKELQGCDPNSVVQAIKNSIKWNLTLDPSAQLVYLMTRNVKNANGWVKVMTAKRSPNGALSFARQTGRILDHERPAVTYKQVKYGDQVVNVVNGVSVKLLLPSYPQPRWELFEFNEDEMNRWKLASHKDKSRNKEDAGQKWYCNELYMSFNGGPDPEFIRAKAIQHALKKLGVNQSEAPIQQVEVKPSGLSPEANQAATFDDYEDLTTR